MTESLGLDPATTSASLALFSAAQGASRVCTGIASELALRWKVPWFFGCCSAGGRGWPRASFLALASLVSAVSHFVLAVSTSAPSFAFGVALSGVVRTLLCCSMSVCSPSIEVAHEFVAIT